MGTLQGSNSIKFALPPFWKVVYSNSKDFAPLIFNLFTPECLTWTLSFLSLDTFIVANTGFSLLTWTLSFLSLDTSIVANTGFSKNNNKMANSVDPAATAISFGSALFAKVYVLVCKEKDSNDRKTRQLANDASMSATKNQSTSINPDMTVLRYFLVITKTRLFKYIENFSTKNWKFSDKNFWYLSHFSSKHRLWVLVRTASPMQF